MLYTLESEFLKISANSLGAELWHLICKKTGAEYLWQGKAPFWPGRSPVLFPIVGRLKDGSMNIHGFAQFCEFHATAEPGKLIFTLSDSPETRQVYPFAFLLEVIFTLEGNRLNTEYRVTNPSDTEDLIFGIGGHPGFVCPITPETEFDDYFLEFENTDSLNTTVVSSNGLLEDRTIRIDLENSCLPLSYDLFTKYDTIVLVDTPVKKVALKSAKSARCISMDFDARHFAIWTQPGAPFICLEPWDGLPDYESTCGDFAKKRENNILAPKTSKTFSHNITIS